MSHLAMNPSASSSSGDSSIVKGLIRKYSSDSDVSPEARPPVKKFITNLGTIMPNTDEQQPSTAAATAGNGGGGAPPATPIAPMQVPPPWPPDIGPPPTNFAEVSTFMVTLMTALRTDIIYKIQVSENNTKQLIQEECKKIEDRMRQEINAVKTSVSAVEASVTTLQQNVTKAQQDVISLDTRLKTVEDALAAGGAIVRDYDPEVTVIVTSVSYSDTEDVKQKCQEIIDHVRAKATPPLGPIPVVNAVRTPMRNGKPGVIKLQLPSRENKIDILKNKKSLSDHTTYSRAFIRGSHSHTERLIHLNTNTLLNELGLADRYRMTGNGRLALKQPTDQQNGPPQNWNANDNTYGQPPYGQPPYIPPGQQRPPGQPWQFGPPNGGYGPPHRPPFNPRQ